MYQLNVERRFNATHALRLADGMLEPVHDHDWHVIAVVASPKLNGCDLVMDFHELEQLLDAVMRQLHHTHLNDLPAFAERNPSAERVAEFIAGQLMPGLAGRAQLARVSVTEAPGCVASYLPD